MDVTAILVPRAHAPRTRPSIAPQISVIAGAVSCHCQEIIVLETGVTWG